jgi:tetratricopeptide (TPR) repeat protein
MTDGLDGRLEVMKREIDALQIAVTGSSKPWYKNISLMVSVIALLFSFGTTYVSYRRAAVQEIQNTRQELRELLQRLTALPRENVENMKKYASDPASMAMVGGFINQENTLLARQAAELAKRLPAEAVTAVEYYSVALALQNAYDLAGAADFLNLTTQSATDFNTEIAAMRMKAHLQFIQGRAESGRVEYQKALDIFSKYEDYDPFTKLSTNVWTELAWANSEALFFGPQSSASQHVENAKRLLDAAVPSPGVENLKAQVSQAEQQLAGHIPIAPVSGPQFGVVPSAMQGDTTMQRDAPADPR